MRALLSAVALGAMWLVACASSRGRVRGADIFYSYFRDAKITEIYEGTSEIQRLVIARSVLKE